MRFNVIHLAGKQTPTREQVKIVKSIADDSFVRQLPDDFGARPTMDGYDDNTNTAIAIKCKNVEPHTDSWCGNRSGWDEEVEYVSFFWLIATTGKYEKVYVQVGNQSQCLESGDFIVFDDQIMHCVMADRQWFGVCYQARKI